MPPSYPEAFSTAPVVKPTKPAPSVTQKPDGDIIDASQMALLTFQFLPPAPPLPSDRPFCPNTTSFTYQPSPHDVIFTTYLTSVVDPQRGVQFRPNRFAYMQRWYRSVERVGAHAVIFHDGACPWVSIYLSISLYGRVRFCVCVYVRKSECACEYVCLVVCVCECVCATLMSERRAHSRALIHPHTHTRTYTHTHAAGLSTEFMNAIKTPWLSFERMELKGRSTNDGRFYAWHDYLIRHPNIERVLLTDLSGACVRDRERLCGGGSSHIRPI